MSLQPVKILAHIEAPLGGWKTKNHPNDDANQIVFPVDPAGWIEALTKSIEDNEHITLCMSQCAGQCAAIVFLGEDDQQDIQNSLLEGKGFGFIIGNKAARELRAFFDLVVAATD